MNTRNIVFIITLAVCLSTVGAEASVPYQCTFQGTLTDTSGIPINGTRDFQFLLYADSTGGSSLWSESHSLVDVSNGLFRVLLGSTTPFPDSIFTGQVLWLETLVESETLDPREKIVSVPYSIKSGKASHAVTADSATHAVYADTSNWSIGDVTVTHVDTADFAFYADSAASAGFASQASHATTSDTALFAVTSTPDDDWVIDGDSLYTNLGYVGIGTSSPTDLLTIDGASAKGITMIGGTGAPFLTFVNPDNLYASVLTARDGQAFTVEYPANTKLMVVDTTGNVGIGTETPYAKLEISGTNEAIRTSATGDPTRAVQMRYHGSIGPLIEGDGYPRLTFDADVDAAGILVLGRGGDNVGIGVIDPVNKLDVPGKMAVGLTYAGNYTGPDNSLIVEGNVGIGTHSPIEMLDVNGTAQMTGFKMPTGADSGYVLTSDASGVGNWQPASGNIGGSGSAGYLSQFTDTQTLGNSAIFQRGDSIGIGTTTPTEKVHIVGTAKMSGFQMSSGANNGYVLTANASGYGTWQSTIGGSGSTNYIPKFAGTNTLGNSVIQQNGTNITINGSAITHTLNITNSSSDDVLRLIGPGSFGYGARLNFGDGDLVYLDEDEDD